MAGRSLARNTVLNFLGQAAPLAVAALSLPPVVRGLGVDRFGLFSLSWTILVYIALADLGLGAATTKFVAAHLSRGEEDQIPGLVGTVLAAQFVLSLIGATGLFIAAPLVVTRLLNVAPELDDDAIATFHVLAVGIPIMALSNCWVAYLQGAQRFGIVNFVRIPSNAASYLAPLCGIALGLSLPIIVALVVGARLITFLVLCRIGIQSIRRHGGKLSLVPQLLIPLLRFGGWLTILSVINPLVIPAERLLVSNAASTAAVTYYSVPYELLLRLMVVPISLGITLFPAFSAIAGTGDNHRLEVLFARSLKFTLLLLGPATICTAIFAEEILRFWIGADFAEQAAPVLRVMAIGTLAASLSFVPYNLLTGVGRPDIATWLQLIELPLYLLAFWQFTLAAGPLGAATAYSARMVIDCLLTSTAAIIAGRLSVRALWLNGAVLSGIAIILIAVLDTTVRWLGSALPLLVQSSVIAASFAAFGWIAWHALLDGLDRAAVIGAVRFRVRSSESSDFA